MPPAHDPKNNPATEQNSLVDGQLNDTPGNAPGDSGDDTVVQPRRSAASVLGTLLSPTIAPLKAFVESVGNHLHLLGQCLKWGIRRPFRIRLFLEAAESIGIGSLPIILLVGAFSGMVTSLQSVSAFRMLKAEGYAGSAVGLSLAVELAPVLTALMLTGRVGAGIATEIGTMRISEQIDALETMAVSPIQYLVVPRVLVGTIVTPLLTMTFFSIGMVGAYLVAVIMLGVDHGLFVENFRWYVDPSHIAQGLIKSTVFGTALTLIGCYQGYHAYGGGRGVGLATTRAVVVGSVSVLVLDYFLSDVLLAVFE
ncbi:MAG: ABC transporter permease [Pseudomonadota bacterium]